MQNTLGSKYQMGIGTDPDSKQAAFWYQKASNQGNIMAQHNLGIMYKNGGIGLPRDLRQAKAWYEKVMAHPDTPDNAHIKERAELSLREIGETGIR